MPEKKFTMQVSLSVMSENAKFNIVCGSTGDVYGTFEIVCDKDPESPAPEIKKSRKRKFAETLSAPVPVPVPVPVQRFIFPQAPQVPHFIRPPFVFIPLPSFL